MKRREKFVHENVRSREQYDLNKKKYASNKPDREKERMQDYTRRIVPSEKYTLLNELKQWTSGPLICIY